MNLDAITCLSRNDFNKDNFMKVRKHSVKKRRNFYNLVEVDIITGMLVCQNESIALEDICKDNTKDPQKCTLKNTNEVIYINIASAR